MIASTPAAARRTISSGSFTVQVFTAIPTVCASSTTVAAASVGEHAEERMDGTVPAGDARRRARRAAPGCSTIRYPVGTRDRARGPGRSTAGGTTTRARRRRRPRDRAGVDDERPRRASSGSKSASFGRVLDLDVHQDARGTRRAPRQGRQPVGSAPDRRRESCSARTPKPSISASWWTTSAPSAVRWTSSSTPSAPSSRAQANASSVFSRARRGAPR